MFVVLFRSRLRDGYPQEEYERTAERMLELARQVRGFVSFDHYTNPAGDRLTVVRFETDGAVATWRTNVEHMQAQQRGREAFYTEYDVTVAEVRRAYQWSASEVVSSLGTDAGS